MTTQPVKKNKKNQKQNAEPYNSTTPTRQHGLYYYYYQYFRFVQHCALFVLRTNTTENIVGPLTHKQINTLEKKTNKQRRRFTEATLHGVTTFIDIDTSQ